MPVSKLEGKIIQVLNFLEWVARYYLLTSDERIDILMLYEGENLDKPLVSRKSRLALLRIALSLPPGLTLALYLSEAAAGHPLNPALFVGVLALSAYAFQKTSALIRVCL